MTVKELTEALSRLPQETQDLRVCVQDGLDPSDSEEATEITVAPHWHDKQDCVHIK